MILIVNAIAIYTFRLDTVDLRAGYCVYYVVRLRLPICRLSRLDSFPLVVVTLHTVVLPDYGLPLRWLRWLLCTTLHTLHGCCLFPICSWCLRTVTYAHYYRTQTTRVYVAGFTFVYIVHLRYTHTPYTWLVVFVVGFPLRTRCCNHGYPVTR